MPRQHLHACWCAREEEVLPVVVHVNEDISVFSFFCVLIVVCVWLSYRSLSTPKWAEDWKRKKNSKRKVGTHIPLNKNLLEARRQRTHTHTHTHTHTRKEAKKKKKNLRS